jgi:hypothetical protein
MRPRTLAATAAAAAATALIARTNYRLVVSGALAPDLDLGRTVRPLGPITIEIDAPRGLVYEVVAAPYLGRPASGTADEITVLERGTDLVLAAHRTTVSDGRVATTVETVRFTPQERVDFRLVRGPVPHVVETFHLRDEGTGTRLDYTGELGTDLWAIGRLWGDQVATRWEQAVASSLDKIKAIAEGREARHAARRT